MDIYFEAVTPIGITITTTSSYGQKIVTFKHPSMKGRVNEVKEALSSPEQIRISKKDPQILLCYRKHNLYYTCVVVKVTNSKGFIVTAYMTDKIKEGKLKWQK